MTRQGSWWKDFWHGVRLAWRSAWIWQRVYKLERAEPERLAASQRVQRGKRK